MNFLLAIIIALLSSFGSVELTDEGLVEQYKIEKPSHQIDSTVEMDTDGI